MRFRIHSIPPVACSPVCPGRNGLAASVWSRALVIMVHLLRRFVQRRGRRPVRAVALATPGTKSPAAGTAAMAQPTSRGVPVLSSFQLFVDSADLGRAAI